MGRGGHAAREWKAARPCRLKRWGWVQPGHTLSAPWAHRVWATPPGPLPLRHVAVPPRRHTTPRRRLLVFNPNKRLSVEEALRHPYVAQFHSSQVSRGFGVSRALTPQPTARR
jgi:hypothetical protein